MRGSGDAGVRPQAVRACALISLAAALALSGCAGAPAVPAPSSRSATPAAAEHDAPVTPSAAPVLHPEGSAQANLPLFTAIVAQVWAGPNGVSGRAYIDALTAAGFTRADMQVTADETTVGNPAESIQFSVRWGDAECLVGQVGPSTGDPVTAVLPQVGGGRCLIGRTVPIEP